MILVVFATIVCFNSAVFAFPPVTTASNTLDNVEDDINNLKYSTKLLAVHLQKWNTLYLTTLEPRMSSFSSLGSSINSNLERLQERAHVWDTFQLHVSAWNDQLSTLDRKVDIISKGQEKLIILESKLNLLTNLEYKIDDIVKMLAKLQENVNNLGSENEDKTGFKSNMALFGDFAARGILSTVKTLEKKVDRLLLHQQNNLILAARSSDEKPKLSIKCNMPHLFEELLNDISSKVDLIYDKSNQKVPLDIEDEIGSGSAENEQDFQQANFDSHFIKRAVKKINKPCKKMNETIQKILESTERLTNVINATKELIETKQCASNITKIENVCKEVSTNVQNQTSDQFKEFNAILNSHFSEQKAHFESTLKKYSDSIINSCEKKSDVSSSNANVFSSVFPVNFDDNPTTTEEINFDANDEGFQEPNLLSCDDLDADQKSGIYNFGSSANSYTTLQNRYFRRYCLIRPDGIWTVIQNRDYFLQTQNFNLSWTQYKNGFGKMSKDFWFGNEYIHKLSSENNLVLLIELEDFDSNVASAKYSNFKVFSELQKYQLLVNGFQGNATDSFSSHNGSYFSTYDVKNDDAPACCPCSESYGGGWWFNKCFDSNLNGLYFKTPITNTYFKGIIWEHWLGNYSLKKTRMMVKLKQKNDASSTTIEPNPNQTSSTNWPYYEDP